jgi:polysaccharide deacetylase family protein (PEP-CTERM system associated)
MTPTALGQPSKRPPRGPRAAEPPFISVVVPVRNEERFLRRTLEQLLTQDYDPERFEVLVADGRSTDATREVVQGLQESHANLCLLDNPGRLASAGRNVAIQAAQGELLLIVDGHCEVDGRTHLRDLAEVFALSGADCVGRPQPLDVTAATPLQRAIAAARASWLGHNPSSHIYADVAQFVRPQSVAVAYRREVFTTVGLFDEQFDACEDVEFNHRVERAGLRCFFSPRVRVRYHPRSSLLGLFRQLQRYGRGRVRLLRKHPETFSVACLVPAGFVLGLAAGPALAALNPWLAGAYAAGLGVYGLTVGLASTLLAYWARDFGLLPRLPLVFAAIHGGAGVGAWQELLAGWFRRRAVAPAAPAPAPAHVLRLPGIAATPREVPAQPAAPPLLNALTIDVEDYYHVSAFEKCVKRSDWDRYESRVVASTHRILDVLEAASVRATFFVLGWVADRHPQLVRTLHAAGHEIGCHGYWHRLVYDQTPTAFREDLCRARDTLQDLIGERVVAYRAPSFSITDRSLWALDVLLEEGFRIDSSIFPTYHDRYGLAGARPEPHQIERPAGTLWEFPLPVHRVLGYPVPVGGGGYLRLFPYRFTRHGLRAINAHGRPFVTYLHPWELDPDQPRLAPGRFRAFRHYVNLDRTERRLRRLLQDFRFGPISEALARFHSDGDSITHAPRRAA